MNVGYTILVAVIAAGLSQAIIAFANKRKTQAETTNLLSEAAERLVLRLEGENKLQTDSIRALREQTAILQTEIVELTNKVEEQTSIIKSQNKEIHELRDEINILRGEVSRLGGDPDRIGH